MILRRPDSLYNLILEGAIDSLYLHRKVVFELKALVRIPSKLRLESVHYLYIRLAQDNVDSLAKQNFSNIEPTTSFLPRLVPIGLKRFTVVTNLDGKDDRSHNIHGKSQVKIVDFPQILMPRRRSA